MGGSWIISKEIYLVTYTLGAARGVGVCPPAGIFRVPAEGSRGSAPHTVWMGSKSQSFLQPASLKTAPPWEGAGPSTRKVGRVGEEPPIAPPPTGDSAGDHAPSTCSPAYSEKSGERFVK